MTELLCWNWIQAETGLKRKKSGKQPETMMSHIEDAAVHKMPLTSDAHVKIHEVWSLEVCCA